MSRTTSSKVLVLGLCAIAGCATSFQGEAKFPGGPRACYKRCAAAGLEMSSFVYVGEYSTGCVCGLKASMRTANTSQDERDVTAATSAAAVGVVLQMRRAQAQAAAAQNAAMTQPHALPPR
jgi:hypothetical protein